MILGLVTVRDATGERLLKEPVQIWRVIAPDETSLHRGSSLDLTDGELVSTDLDKAWHGIHYLLTGTAGEGKAPLNFLVAGGRVVGNIDVGYGPARVLNSKEVAAAHEALGRFSDDDLRARFRPEDMTEQEIYPEIWDSDPEEDDTLGYLMEYVQILRGFLSQAVSERRGLVLYLS